MKELFYDHSQIHCQLKWMILIISLLDKILLNVGSVVSLQLLIRVECNADALLDKSTCSEILYWLLFIPIFFIISIFMWTTVYEYFILIQGWLGRKVSLILPVYLQTSFFQLFSSLSPYYFHLLYLIFDLKKVLGYMYSSFFNYSGTNF